MFLAVTGNCHAFNLVFNELNMGSRLALGITTIIQSRTTFSFTSSIFLNLWVPIAAAFLVLMTTLISFRIIAAQRAILKIGGPLIKLQNNYTGIVAILVEAALPFSVLCVVLAVALARAWDCILILMAIWGCGAVRHNFYFDEYISTKRDRIIDRPLYPF